MYRRMTLIGVLTAVASVLVFGIANAMPATNSARTAVTFVSDTSMPDTSMPDTSTVTAPSSSDMSVLDAAVVGPTTYMVGEAGSVTINYDGSSLRLTSADANDPWTAFSEQTSGQEIEVNFSNGNREIKFNAELEDGGIRIRVRDRINDETTTVTTDTTMVENAMTDTSTVTSTTIDDDSSDDIEDNQDDSSIKDSDDDHDDDDDSSNRGSDDDDDHDDHDEDEDHDDHGGNHGDDD